MSITFIDYYLIFLLFFIIFIIVCIPSNFFNYKITSNINKTIIYYNVSLVNFIIKIIRIALIFTLIFLIVGCESTSSSLIISDTIFKNFFLLSKIIFFSFILIFLNIVEYYVKLVHWLNNDFIILFYISIIALSLILYVDSLFNFYLILEMYSLSIIGCLSLKKTKFKLIIESLLKYFFINALSSCFILFGISIIYANTALNNLLDLRYFFWLANDHPNFFYSNIGIFIFLIGLFIKISAFPFNYWFIDIYSSLPLIFTLFLLIFPKFIFSNFLFLFYNTIGNTNYLISNLILYFSILTILVNVFISFYQIKIKKLIIITSFSNLPFFILFIYLKNFNSIVAFFGFSIIYYINLIGIFIFLMFFVNLKSKNGIFFKKISSLINLFKINKKLAIIFTSFLLSVAGFPPLSGFFGKFYFLSSLITSDNILLFFFFSFINLLLIFVYLRVIKIIFQSNNTYGFKFININSRILIFYFILFFFFNITTIFYFDIIFNMIKYFLINNEWIFTR